MDGSIVEQLDEFFFYVWMFAQRLADQNRPYTGGL
jgi:hypothetical protein